MMEIKNKSEWASALCAHETGIIFKVTDSESQFYGSIFTINDKKLNSYEKDGELLIDMNYDIDPTAISEELAPIFEKDLKCFILALLEKEVENTND